MCRDKLMLLIEYYKLAELDSDWGGGGGGAHTL